MGRTVLGMTPEKQFDAQNHVVQSYFDIPSDYQIFLKKKIP